jgi:heme A synthase
LLNLPVLSSENPEPLRKSGVGGGEFRNISRVARATLGYTIFVILFGAVVRITGSGAGCGQHWPTCNGEIAHLPRRLETLIELTHRVTSAGALLAVLAFAAVAVLESPRRHRLRSAAWAAVGLMLVEALIGAGLVLWRLVAHDTSTARAVVMPAHLVSTYALVGVLTLGVSWSRPKPRHPESVPTDGGAVRWLVAGALLVVVVAATGALTALGDTLYPPAAQTLAARVVEDQGQAAHGLQRLRVLHPLLAVLTAGAVVALALRFGAAHRTASGAVVGITALQLIAGVSNVALSAPGWLQVVHLALSVGLWVALVTLIGATREGLARTPVAA